MNNRRHTPKVLGHRGYRARFPENTVLAFTRAFDFGADGIECDLQKSADGRYVVIHDGVVDRVSDGRGSVGGMSYADLRRLDFGQGERVPELTELLAVVPDGRYLDLELKSETLSTADCAPISKILSARADRANLMISSFEPSLLYYFRKRGFVVGLLIGENLASKGALSLAALLVRLRPKYVNLPVQIMEGRGVPRARALLRLLRACGFSILLWTVNTAEEAEALADLAQIVVTDEVEKIVRFRDRTP
jgi:glycerophosphoryl diester phosphodiesterase